MVCLTNQRVGSCPLPLAWAATLPEGTVTSEERTCIAHHACHTCTMRRSGEEARLHLIACSEQFLEQVG